MGLLRWNNGIGYGVLWIVFSLRCLFLLGSCQIRPFHTIRLSYQLRDRDNPGFGDAPVQFMPSQLRQQPPRVRTIDAVNMSRGRHIRRHESTCAVTAGPLSSVS